MSRITLKNYLRYSIRFRVLSCLLVSIALGLTLARLSEAALEGLKLLPRGIDISLALTFFLTLLYAALILMALVSTMLRPIAHFHRRLQELESRTDIRNLDPAEFAELGPLLEITMDYMEWAENQQNLSAAIHHAFRKRIEQLAEYDPLTGLYNRHYLQTVLPLQIAHMANLKDHLSLIMLDVDHFKHYNDTNGHPEGDRVLVQIADLLRSNVRGQDVCCRYGGEEILVVLPNADKDKAFIIAERIRRAIEEAPFRFEKHQPKGRITASLGVSSYPTHASTASELIEYADQAMYLGKRRGRNRTCAYDEVNEANEIVTPDREPAS